MSRSGSRGQTKQKIRDLSANPLTLAEQYEIIDAIAAANSPIAQAILGAVIIEHDLEQSLRRRLSIKDDKIWRQMIDERGALDTFSRKINTGYALKMYDDSIRHNLDIIRNIRNGFAHSKKIISFSHQLIVSELKRIKPMEGQNRFNRIIDATSDPGAKYVSLCFALSAILLKRRTRSLRAETSRYKRRAAAKPSPFARALAPFLDFPTEYSKLTPLSSLDHQTGNPNPAAPQPTGLGLLGLLKSPSDNRGK